MLFKSNWLSPNQEIRMYYQDGLYKIYHYINDEPFDCYYDSIDNEDEALTEFQYVCELASKAIEFWESLGL